MVYTDENHAELNVLLLYNLSSNQEGIKIHKEAAPAVIAAAQRLHNAGFISQPDGGYLTSMGIEAAEHAQVLFTMLDTHHE